MGNKDLAMEKLSYAKRIVETTYPLVQEPKLFLPAVEQIRDALEISMNDLLVSKNISNNIGSNNSKILDSDFESKTSLLSNYISEESKKFIININKTLKEHKDASVEFVRDEKFIISDNDYNMTALSLDSVKNMIEKAENCIKEMY